MQTPGTLEALVLKYYVNTQINVRYLNTKVIVFKYYRMTRQIS